MARAAQELVLCFLVFGLGAAGKAQAVKHHGHTRVIRAEVTLANRYGLSIGEFGGLVVGLPVLLFSRVEQRFGSPSIPAQARTRAVREPRHLRAPEPSVAPSASVRSVRDAGYEDSVFSNDYGTEQWMPSET